MYNISDIICCVFFEAYSWDYATITAIKHKFSNFVCVIIPFPKIRPRKSFGLSRSQGIQAKSKSQIVNPIVCLTLAFREGRKQSIRNCPVQWRERREKENEEGAEHFYFHFHLRREGETQIPKRDPHTWIPTEENPKPRGAPSALLQVPHNFPCYLVRFGFWGPFSIVLARKVDWAFFNPWF